MKVHNDTLQVAVSAETGMMESLQWQGKELLVSGPRLQVLSVVVERYRESPALRGWDA